MVSLELFKLAYLFRFRCIYSIESVDYLFWHYAKWLWILIDKVIVSTSVFIEFDFYFIEWSHSNQSSYITQLLFLVELLKELKVEVCFHSQCRIRSNAILHWEIDLIQIICRNKVCIAKVCTLYHIRVDGNILYFILPYFYFKNIYSTRKSNVIKLHCCFWWLNAYMTIIPLRVLNMICLDFSTAV